MKKKVLSLVFLSGVLMFQPVMAVEALAASNTSQNRMEEGVPFASDYIADYMANLSKSSKTLEIEGYMMTRYTDKIEIKAQIQNYSGSKWADYGTALKTTSTGYSVALDEDKTVVDGKYRVKFTYNAYVDGSVVETRTLTTESVTIS